MLSKRFRETRSLVLAMVVLGAGCSSTRQRSPNSPYLVILGTAQDAGVPQAGAFAHPGWTRHKQRRLVACLALVDPRQGKRWIFDATPDFREQLYLLHKNARLKNDADRVAHSVVDGIFLTHAHIGHYTGLMFLGHESIGAQSVPVYAMPRMGEFLKTNGPWDQLVRSENVELRALRDGVPIALAHDLMVRPVLVPHRQEYSEVVGYRIDGPSASALYLPDIDSWEEWDDLGTRIEDVLADVDVAYLDGTFYMNGEIADRDMSGFPHPFISHSIDRFSKLPLGERKKIRFIHLNHTNPAQFSNSPAARAVRRAGMSIAQELERFGL